MMEYNLVLVYFLCPEAVWTKQQLQQQKDDFIDSTQRVQKYWSLSQISVSKYYYKKYNFFYLFF